MYEEWRQTQVVDWHPFASIATPSIHLMRWLVQYIIVKTTRHAVNKYRGQHSGSAVNGLGTKSSLGNANNDLHNGGKIEVINLGRVTITLNYNVPWAAWGQRTVSRVLAHTAPTTPHQSYIDNNINLSSQTQIMVVFPRYTCTHLLFPYIHYLETLFTLLIFVFKSNHHRF